MSRSGLATSLSMRPTPVTYVIAMVLFFTSSVCAQFGDDFPKGTAVTISSTTITAMKNTLRGSTDNWNEFLTMYYGGTYQKLPDLLVYIDSNYNIRSRLFCNGAPSDFLFGEKFVWVVLVSDRDLNPSGNFVRQHISIEKTRVSKEIAHSSDTVEIKTVSREERDTVGCACKIKHESLEYQEEPKIKTVVSVLTSLLAGKAVDQASASEGNADSAQYVLLDRYGDNATDGPHLYIRDSKFRLALNTSNRISIIPTLKDLPFRYYNFSFPNAEKSRLTANLGIGYYANPAPAAQCFLFGELLLARPLEPVGSESFGLILGTVIEKNLLSNIALGLECNLSYVSRDLGPIGVFAAWGGSFNSAQRFIAKPCIGIDFRL